MALKSKVIALACALLPLAMAARAQQLAPAEEGRRLFLANNCYGCHGGRAGGGIFGAPNLRGEAELGDLSEAIREGEDRGMPSFPNLNNSTDINNIYAYLRSLRTSSEPIFNLWWEPIPTARVQPRIPRIYAAVRLKETAYAHRMMSHTNSK